MDVHLISTLVNKILYYYYHYLKVCSTTDVRLTKSEYEKAYYTTTTAISDHS